MEYRHFRLVIVGENPDELLEKYKKREVEPYVVYELSKAKEYKEAMLKYYKELIRVTDGTQKKMAETEYDLLKNEEPLDYYLEITDGYDIDEETGNAMSTNNPDQKFDSCNLGGRFSLPLITKDGKETYQARKKDIDWGRIHLYGKEPYEVAWETVMEGRKPESKDEEIIYNNMKNRTSYFHAFGDKDSYISACTAFWGYAYLDKNGWKECSEDQFEWAKNFFSIFIEKLDDDALITIYECVRE